MRDLAAMPNLLSGTIYAPALQVVTNPVEPNIAKEAELLGSPTCIHFTLKIQLDLTCLTITTFECTQ